MLHPVERQGREWGSPICPAAHPLPSPSTHILRMMISFLAAFRTFRPSRFKNFLQVYSFPVVFSLARKISQNSSLQGHPQPSPPLPGPLSSGCSGGPQARQHPPPIPAARGDARGWKEAVAKNLSGAEGGGNNGQ